MSRSSPSSGSWTIEGAVPTQPQTINLADEDSDGTVDYGETVPQVILDSGATHPVIGEAHLQAMQRHWQQQMGMMAQGMQSMQEQMHQQQQLMQQAMVQQGQNLQSQQESFFRAIYQSHGQPTMAPSATPAPGDAPQPKDKKATLNYVEPMECDEDEDLPSPTKPTVVLPTSQPRSSTTRSEASSSTETPTGTSSAASSATSSAQLASLMVLAAGAANATTVLRSLWRLRLKESEKRNREREAQPKHMKDKSPLARWSYLLKWKVHQKLVDTTSRLLKTLKEDRLTEGYIHPKDKAKAERVPKSKAKSKAKTPAQ